MSPVALLFSSDEESSRRVVQALRELELEIEPCPDIFTAVEWLTSRSFDVIVADWDSGPEAPFLLTNARELKLNKAAFTLALSSGTSKVAPGHDSPDLVLTKPLIPDQVKYGLLSNDRFLGCLRAWIARGDFVHPRETSSSGTIAKDIDIDERRPQLQEPSPAPLAARPAEPSPGPSFSYSATAARLNLTFATLDRSLFGYRSRRNRGEYGSGEVKRYSRNRVLWWGILSLAFVSVGYIFGQPLRVQSVFASVASAYKQAVETKSSNLERAKSDHTAGSPMLVQAAALQRSGPGRYPLSAGRGVQTMLPPEQIPTAETLQANARPDLPTAGSRVLIPESLTLPQPEAATVRNVGIRRSPSLLSQVEPVSLSEDSSQAMLLQRVTPSYPEQALKAGLQGAVILQAWIGKDGNIRDLKLVDGSLLLGQAAVKAVKQWRYKPYLRNGVAVEAETYVTVKFKLP